MRENFNRALGFSLSREGYKTDDPRDPGKLTIWGFSALYHPVEVARMARMSKEEALKYASGLYLEKYWIPAGCDSLSCPKDLIIFDVSINPGFALVKTLLSGSGDWKDYLFDRIQYYNDRVIEKPARAIFFRGWVNRTLLLKKMIEQKATG